MSSQLIATRKEILTAIDGIPEHLFNMKKSEQSWSVGQVLDHLHKIEVEITKLIKHIITLPDQKPFKDKPLAMTLDRTKKRPAPSSLIPSNQALEKQHILVALSQSRHSLLQLIDSIPPDIDFKRKGYKHPVFDELSLTQWIEFIGYHEKRHLAQIIEIKESIVNENV